MTITVKVSDPIDKDSKLAEFADSGVEVSDYTYVTSGIIFLKEKDAPIVNNKYLC